MTSMMRRHTANSQVIAFATSGRRDFRYWGMFLIGSVFVYAGFTIDPASNCSDGGECAPWLVPLAAVLGMAFCLGGLAQLISNAARGSRIDAAAGRLDWWQNRYPGRPGDCGTIALDQIDRILIKRDSEDTDISLYDRQGERLAFFDTEVIGQSAESWAGRVRELVPGIRVEYVD